jgi:tetraacyldisaccharide 4'-kinase
MGGSGKTPFVLMLARRFREREMQPAILTRGYRRRSPANLIVIEAGGSAPAPMTGDEAQMFVRSGVAHVGIGSHRWAAGEAILEKLQTDVFLLDDGFQHRRLARDVDLVLIDALDPFAGGAVFPRGRLREPPSALARAHAFVITRAQPGRRYTGLRQRLRDLNPSASIFLSTVEPRRWIDAATGQETQQPPSAGAFCGLGNPNSFWQTLRALGLEPVFTWAFGDHHVYKPLQLRRLAAQARSQGSMALVTTQKDAMNLPANFVMLIAPVKLYWLEVEAKVEDERDLLQFIDSKIATGPRRSSCPPVSRQA